jgi:hypothetical protein
MRLIVRDLARLENSACEVRSANRRIVGDFIGSNAIRFVDDILAGIQTEGYNGVEWDHDVNFSLFKKHIFSERYRMEKNLASILYNIDQENTLAVVTGGGSRPETVRLQLLSCRSIHSISLTRYPVCSTRAAPAFSALLTHRPLGPIQHYSLGRIERD